MTRFPTASIPSFLRLSGLLLTVSMLALAGCGQFDKPPATQIEAPAPAASQRWWDAFHDPLMEQLTTQLLAQNIDIKIAQARVEEARAVGRISEGALYPNVTVTGNDTRSKSEIFTKDPITIAQGGFDANWEIDLFGSNRAGAEAAQSRTVHAVATADDARNTVLADLVRAVLEWRQAQETVHVTEALLAAQDEQIALLTERTKAGVIDSSGLVRAQAERAQTATQLPLAQASARTAQYQAERLLGQSSGALDAMFSGAVNQPLAVPEPDATLDLGIEVIRARPDIRAAKATMLAAQSDLVKAEADLWPKLSLQGFFGAQHLSSGLVGPSNPIWSLAAGITSPVFNFYSFRSAVDQANAASKEAALTYENQVLLAVQETHTALSDYLNGINAVTQQAAALDRRSEAVKLADERFRAGASDRINLTTAQSELDQANLALVTQKATAAIAYIRLQKALAVAVRTPAAKAE